MRGCFLEGRSVVQPMLHLQVQQVERWLAKGSYGSMVLLAELARSRCRRCGEQMKDQ